MTLQRMFISGLEVQVANFKCSDIDYFGGIFHICLSLSQKLEHFLSTEFDV
jgi:hypothetical protein